jgi:hypothetical protein
VKKTVFQVEKRKNHRETSWMLAGFTLKKNVKKTFRQSFRAKL